MVAFFHPLLSFDSVFALHYAGSFVHTPDRFTACYNPLPLSITTDTKPPALMGWGYQDTRGFPGCRCLRSRLVDYCPRTECPQLYDGTVEAYQLFVGDIVLR